MSSSISGKIKSRLTIKDLYKKRRAKAALCLGGGGARGFAHIGAIKAFEEESIDFDCCFGTSVGSLIGAFYCAGMSSDTMIEYAHTLNMKELHNGIILLPNDPSKISNVVTRLIGDIDFDQLKKKLVCVAVNLCEGKQVILESGNVAKSVAASCCVPMFYRPVIIGEQHLVDGGLLNNIPADVARMMGNEVVITVDINPTRGGQTSSTKVIDVIKATFAIMSANSSITGLINSDVIIEPDLSMFKSSSKDGYMQMYELGYKEARLKIDQINKLMYY